MSESDSGPNLVTCPRCGAQYLATATTCADCGARLRGAGDEGDEVAYDLADWAAEQREDLVASLAAEGVAARLEDTELVVPEAADLYRDRSPVHRADTITAPLLILQGADDDIVPPAQSRAIADRVRAQGGEVELHLYEGEGHGWSRPETVVDELQRTEAFLRRHVLRVAR